MVLTDKKQEISLNMAVSLIANNMNVVMAAWALAGIPAVISLFYATQPKGKTGAGVD